MHFQYAIPVCGFDLIALDGLRQVEGTGEFSRNPLDPVVLDAIGRLLNLSLATER